MNKQHFRKLHHEKGLATLTIVLLLLFVATLVTLYTANTTVREQQVSANQYRADQALSAANAGLDYALAYYFKYTGPDAVVNDDLTDFSGDGIIDVLTVPTLSGGEGEQEVFATVTIRDVDDLTNAENGAFNGPHTITAVGFSDDRSATRTIEVQVDAFGIIPGGGLPGFPLIAKGAATNGGNFTIINRFSNATIWTGADTIDFGSAKTYILNVERGVNGEWVRPVLDPVLDHDTLVSLEGVGTANPADVLDATFSEGGLNSDVISNDDNLRNISDDDFFQNFLLEDKLTLETIAKANGQWFNSGDILWSDLEGLRGFVWIDVPGGPDPDATPWAPSGDMVKIGTETYPLTLIINGNFDTGGTGSADVSLIGLLYVIGNWSGTGNFIVQGSCIVESNVDSGGGPVIVYDEALYDGSLGTPPGAIMAVVPGTWKDW